MFSTIPEMFDKPRLADCNHPGDGHFPRLHPCATRHTLTLPTCPLRVTCPPLSPITLPFSHKAPALRHFCSALAGLLGLLGLCRLGLDGLGRGGGARVGHEGGEGRGRGGERALEVARGGLAEEVDLEDL